MRARWQAFFTYFLSPVKMCTFFVPRSPSLISVMPLLAAFNAACFGDLPVKTPFSLPRGAEELRIIYLIHKESTDCLSELKGIRGNKSQALYWHLKIIMADSSNICSWKHAFA
jgi:hypothetical protein